MSTHSLKTSHKPPPINYDKKRRLPSARALEALKTSAPARAVAPPNFASLPQAYSFDELRPVLPPTSAPAEPLPPSYTLEGERPVGADDDDGEDVRVG